MLLTDQEKIQKAEEIYYRRNGMGYRGDKNEKKEPKKHTIKNLLVILLIICGVYVYENRAMLQSVEFQNQVKEFLNTKIDLKNIFNTEVKQQNITNSEENENILQDNLQETVSENQETEAIPMIEELSEETEKIEENIPQEPQYEVIWPHIGEITSEFGYRTSSDSRVTSNHTGIDIAGNAGDIIKSAINGTVVQVSEEGMLGKHMKIENEKIATIYAHCNSIYVTEGQEIIQGQEIGEVGSTGNSTGNHLHFEIIKDGEYIDPLTVIEQ